MPEKMSLFYIWETADFSIKLNGGDGQGGILQGYKDVIVSFGQREILVEKDASDSEISVDTENDIINVHLEQDDTGKFVPNKEAFLQINILFEDTRRDVSAQVRLAVLDNLHKGVMS